MDGPGVEPRTFCILIRSPSIWEPWAQKSECHATERNIASADAENQTHGHPSRKLMSEQLHYASRMSKLLNIELNWFTPTAPFITIPRTWCPL